ncbi:MAG: ABC transporter permease, partial [Firmicutes bacterium]|nr:ABC transporter permease [Bacillota bacterium]
GLIITLSSFIFTTMNYGIGGILAPTEEYFLEANQEDFSISMMDYLLEDDIIYLQTQCTVSTDIFTLSALRSVDKVCYDKMISNRLGAILAEYPNIGVELREHKDLFYNVEGTSHKVRFLKATSTINTSYFVDGFAPSNNSEIAISEIYAKLNNLSIGDTIDFNGKDYTVSGYVLFPDYSLAILSSDLIFDNRAQTLALVTNSEFEALSANVGIEIAGDFLSMSKSDFESSVIDSYRDNENLAFVTNILLTENNMRSGAIYGEIEGGQAMSLGISIMIASIAILIVGIMVSKVLHSKRGPIGILKSMGYQNSEITIPYIFFIMIMSFPMLVLGYFLGFLAAEPFKNMYLIIYLLPSTAVAQTLTTFVTAVIVPFTFIVVVSYFIIKKILSQKPVELLNPQVSTNANWLTKIVGKYLKKLKITSKLQHLLLYRNMVKFFVFLIGMFYAAFLILLSFSMVGVFDRMVVDYYDNTNHNYIGYCDYTTVCNPLEGTQEGVIEQPSVVMNDEEVYLVGISPMSKIHPIYDKKGHEITDKLEDGMIITKSLSLVKGFGVGDNVLIEVGDQEISMKIIAITEEYSGEKAYINITTLSQTLSGTDDYYNTVYSETALNERDFFIVVSTIDIVKQTQSMQQMINIAVGLLIVVSIVIGAVIIYILTVLTIEDNFYNISLFKVMGYNNKEIDKMILGGYLIYGITIFLITMPIAYFTFIYLQVFFAQYYNVLMPFEFKLWHGALSLVIYIVLFYAGAFSAKRHLNKISLQEAMKMYQV